MARFLKNIWKKIPCILKYDILETVWSWKPFSCEYTFIFISTVNIVHMYFSLLKLYVHSQVWYLLTTSP